MVLGSPPFWDFSRNVPLLSRCALEGLFTVLCVNQISQLGSGDIHGFAKRGEPGWSSVPGVTLQDRAPLPSERSWDAAGGCCPLLPRLLLREGKAKHFWGVWAQGQSVVGWGDIPAPRGSLSQTFLLWSTHRPWSRWSKQRPESLGLPRAVPQPLRSS